MGACCASCARGRACEGSGACPVRAVPRRSGGIPAPLGASRQWLATAAPRANRTSGGIRDLRDETEAAGYTPNNAELSLLGVSREQWQNAPARQRLAWSRGEPLDDGPGAGEVIGGAVERGLDTLNNYLRGEQQTQVEQTRAQGAATVANINAAAQTEAERLRLEAERIRSQTALQLAALGYRDRSMGPEEGVRNDVHPATPPPVPPAPPKEDKPAGWTDGQKLAAGAAVVVGAGLLALLVSEAMKPKAPPAPPPGYGAPRGY